MLIYIGPGLGLGSLVLIFIILGIVFLSIGIIVWIPIKKFFKKYFQKKN
jgi:hypothetical protein